MVEQPSQVRDPVEVLAEEFLERRRRGEVPSLKEYIDRYPHLADEIRDVFPAVVMMDEVDPPSAEVARSLGGMGPLSGRLGVRQLGDFRILREIGQGGMGIVYEARQESLGRHVALKVLPPSACRSTLFRERFQREACAAARLHHTNIVPIFGVGEDQGVLYYAMQFIQGQALDAVLEDVKHMRGVGPTMNLADQPTLAQPRGEAARSLISGHFAIAEPILGHEGLPHPIPVANPSSIGTRSELRNQPEHSYYRSIAWLGVQAAEGLAHAHAQGIWHRDIKPSNLLLDAQGTLWVTDFGLAKTEGGEDLTHTGEMVGTLRYMAPERFQGKADARSDIYALGVTLYEMLTLSPPFNGTDRVALVGQITQDDPALPSRLAPHLPRDLETIVQKAMAREPAARYGSARELADDLRRFLENRSIKARRSSAAERLRRWCRRNPVVASLTGTVFLLLVCLAAGSLAVAFRLNEERDALAAAEEDRTEKLYQSLVAEANASRFSRQVGQRFATLEAVRKAAALVRERQMPAKRLDELRNLAIAALVLPDLRTIRTWEGFPAGSQRWETDEQLRLYARSDLKGVISIRRIDTDQETARLGGWRNAWFRFSPDGRFLMERVDDRLRAWDLSRVPPEIVHQGKIGTAAFHPDGRHLLIGRRDGSIRLHNLETPKQKPQLLSAHQPGAQVFAFDRTGDRLAVIRSDKVEILNAKTGKAIALVPEPQEVSQLAWHPGGDYVAFVCATEIHFWNLKRMTRIVVLKGCRSLGIKVAFTPDGARLLSEGWEGMLRLWDWRTGRQVLQRAGTSNLRFGADGRLLILEGSRLNMVELATGREYRTFVHQSNAGGDVEYWRMCLHPNGRLIAVAMSDRTRLFDLERGDELASLPKSGYTVAFAGKKALLTNGPDGLLRWPIREEAGEPNRLHIGPPGRLHDATRFDMDCDREGNVIGQATGNGAFLVRPGKAVAFLGPDGDVRHISISPDGKYAATGIHEGDEGVSVWDTQTGQILVRVPVGSMSRCKFSADGKWLALGGTRGWRMLKVGTWHEGPIVRGTEGCNFSPDGSVFASGSEASHVRLLSLATGQELARLTDPIQDMTGFLVFTGDGARLLNCSGHSASIHVWDLRAIRAQLAKLGLDWDAPPYPAASGNLPTTPLQILVDKGKLDSPSEKRPDEQRLRALIAGYTLQAACAPYHPEPYHERGHVYDALGQFKNAVRDYTRALRWQPPDPKRQAHLHLSRAGSLMAMHQDAEAAADLHKVIELDPNAPLPFNNLAQIYVNGPPELRDPAKALAIATKGLAVAPGDLYCRNTLGVAHYRLGNYEAAVVALERSLRESKGERAAFQLYFLAMSYARLGDAVKARECYDQAVRWVPEQPYRLPPSWQKRLESMRAEADAVLTGKTAAPRPRGRS